VPGRAHDDTSQHRPATLPPSALRTPPTGQPWRNLCRRKHHHRALPNHRTYRRLSSAQSTPRHPEHSAVSTWGWTKVEDKTYYTYQIADSTKQLWLKSSSVSRWWHQKRKLCLTKLISVTQTTITIATRNDTYLLIREKVSDKNDVMLQFTVCCFFAKVILLAWHLTTYWVYWVQLCFWQCLANVEHFQKGTVKSVQ